MGSHHLCRDCSGPGCRGPDGWFHGSHGSTPKIVDLGLLQDSWSKSGSYRWHQLLWLLYDRQTCQKNIWDRNNEVLSNWGIESRNTQENAEDCEGDSYKVWKWVSICHLSFWIPRSEIIPPPYQYGTHTHTQHSLCEWDQTRNMAYMDSFQESALSHWWLRVSLVLLLLHSIL
jgi:hypothetical protein